MSTAAKWGRHAADARGFTSCLDAGPVGRGRPVRRPAPLADRDRRDHGVLRHPHPGLGVNDILYTSPAKLFADLRTLIAALPANAVLLDLPLPAGCWGFAGRACVPYVTRINRTIHQAAAARGLPVARVSAHFTPPWAGKFASDCFHPSQDGYRDWARALLAAVASTPPRSA